MKFGQSILCDVPTKAGPVSVVVNIVADGPKDGAAAVLRDVTEHAARSPRLAGAVVSQPVQLQDGIQDFVDLSLPYGVACDDGMPADSRE